MNPANNYLLLSTLAFSMTGMGQVWLVQLSSYRLWAYVGPREFEAYHIAWWHSIWGPIFVPAGLAVMGTVGLLWWRPVEVSRGSVWMGIVLLSVTYILTWLWWAPLMAMIGADTKGYARIFRWAPQLAWLGLGNRTQGQLYRLLLSTHWLRLALLTAYALLIFRMTWQVIGRKG